MYRKSIAIGAGALLMGVALLASPRTAEASPATFAPDVASQAQQLGGVVEVQRWDRRGDRRAGRYYSRERHGNRYRSPRGRYRHHYDGYYYAVPWWLGVGLGAVIGSQAAQSSAPSEHVAWCAQRYRSYDARTDSFLGYDGVRHRCRSPYVR